LRQEEITIPALPRGTRRAETQTLVSKTTRN
jgi:hypothetical protein